MAITDQQKIDYLFKKLGFGATKTDTAALKGAVNEEIPSPLLLNGNGNFVNLSATKIAVHTAAQSGVHEISSPVSNSLGSTFTDNAIRIFDFSADTINTPSYTSSTIFFSNSVYTEASDPGVAGTKEASIRIGVLKHDVTDYSSITS